jgi:hypothetical protein
MAKDLLHPGSILALHRKAAEALLSAGDGDAALLYLALLSGRDGSPLGWNNERLGRAKNTLLTLGLIDESQPVQPQAPQKLAPSAPPDYTAQDIAMAVQKGGFASLVPEVERLLGKVLSPSDLKTLYLLYDYYSLPAEVILVLVTRCVEETAQKHGPGRKPTLTQIRKAGMRWQEAGVDSLEAADAYLKRQDRMGTRGASLFHQFTGETRSPIPKEQAYLDRWMDLPFDDEALLMARDRTLFQKGKFVWSYANGILNSWAKQGLFTAQDIRAAERRRTSSYTPRPNGAQGTVSPVSGADVDRFFADLEAAPQNPQNPPPSHHKEG